MASVDESYNIILDRAADFSVPIIFQSSDSPPIQVDIGGASLALVVTLSHGQAITLVPGPHPSDPKGREFVFSAAFSQQLSPRPMQWELKQTTNAQTFVLARGTICAQ